MISLVLLLVFSWQFYIGYSRGLVLQLYYSAASIVAFVGASFYYKRLADALTLWVPYSSPTEDAQMSFFQSVNIFELDRVFYAGVAFIIIYCLLYLLLRLLGVVMHFFNLQVFDDRKYSLLSGVLAVLLLMGFMSMVLTVVATLPLTFIQTFLGNNWLLRLLIHLPGLSHLLQALWVTAIL